MKVTSKILFATLASVMLISLLYFVVLAVIPGYRGKYIIDDSKLMALKVPDCPYLKIEGIGTKVSGAFRIASSSDSLQQGKLFLPEEMKKYITTRQEGDTLVVRFTGLEALTAEMRTDSLYNFNLHYYPVQLRGMKNVGFMKVHFNTFRSTYPLWVEGASYVGFLGECVLPALDVRSTYTLELRDSQVDTLSLDLDSMERCTIEDCHIQVENLTASRDYHYYQYSGKNPAVRNWTPKNKKARFFVELLDTPAQIIYKE